MKISNDGLKLIKRYEGLKLNAYKCPANVWTIGYGHTYQVRSGDKITESVATEYLKNDVRHAQNAIDRYVKVSISQYQFDALVSFIYNVGAGAFKKSTLLKMLNKRNYEGASNQFKRWNKAGGRVLKGLSRRRADEAELFANDTDVEDMPQAIDAPIVKTSLTSKTNISSIAGIGGIALTQLDTIKSTFNDVTDLASQGGDIADKVGGLAGAFDWKMMAVIGVIGLFGYIIYERNKKVDEHGV